MLNACWECIAGSRRENEERNIRLNGSSQRAPPWPVSQLKNENMFILPKQVSLGDQITVAGYMTTKRQLSVSLVTGSMSPDYENIACQLEVTFETSETNALEKDITIKTIKNGQVAVESTNDTGGYFPDNSFKFKFHFERDTKELEIHIGESFYQFIKLKHNIDDIRFLLLSGDIAKVETLDFYFA